jgi:acetylornithine deacetylase/succinyl-diaminopimelate desuccinylase-like protein
MELFNILSDVLRTADPGGIPIPIVLPGVTDARHFARLGIQTYGYLPMILPEDFNFAATIHAANERIPTDALDYGTNAIAQVLTRFV